ncbi:copper chaperone PCu(A)C [Melaminivora sp.]|uniref:copper chaperone PCu(A)C n=1 Tax=Melaminivora sp. TaxID=1933032 RepID=UPI0028A6CD1C|nr:copper chaperone PCu(A)C [Melaminivora sp.]
MRTFSVLHHLAAAGALLLASAAQAQVSVHDAWVRAAVPQQQATGAFMRLTSAQDARLVSVTSPVAGVAEVHEMRLEGDVMRMRAIAALELPAGQAVELKPGGYHIMLMDLRQPVAAGASVPLTLVFEGPGGQRQTLQVQAPVRALGRSSGQGRHGASH